MGVVTYLPDADLVVTDTGDTMTWQEYINNKRLEGVVAAENKSEPAEAETQPELTEKEKQKRFFFGEPQKLSPLAEEWKREGRCPKCGETGRVHLSTFVCSVHGPY